MNKFSAAIVARLARKSNDAKNMQSLQRFADAIERNTATQELLTACNVNERIFDANVYTIDKLRNIVELVTNAISARNFNEINRCVFETAIAFEKAERAFDRNHAMHSCSAHYKIEKDLKALVKQSKEHRSERTCASQHSSTLAALEALNVIRSINKSEFRVNLDNDATRKIAKKLEIAL